MNLPIYQVDAFHHALFKGNPAAVCPLDKWLPEKLMQSIAMENNLSETAFFVPDKDGFAIRWFTPVREVDLCGHATLAAAHVLFRHLSYEKEVVKFSSASGDLFVKQGEEGRLYLDFPAADPKKIKNDPKFRPALGRQPFEAHLAGKLMLIYRNEEEVRNLRPDYSLIATINDAGIIVTAPGKDFDFVSRFFAPSVGIDEDPVTGSAHTLLIPYWSGILGKNELTAWQCSPRGGILYCTNQSDRVLIGGHAVTYMTGHIHIPS